MKYDFELGDEIIVVYCPRNFETGMTGTVVSFLNLKKKIYAL